MMRNSTSIQHHASILGRYDIFYAQQFQNKKQIVNNFKTNSAFKMSCNILLNRIALSCILEQAAYLPSLVKVEERRQTKMIILCPCFMSCSCWATVRINPDVLLNNAALVVSIFNLLVKAKELLQNNRKPPAG